MNGSLSPDDDDLQAAELALGLLDPVEHDAAIARTGAEPDFGALHHLWLARALTLTGVQAVQPGPRAWDRIIAALPKNTPTRISVARAPRPGWLEAVAVAAAFVTGWEGGHWTARPPIVRAVAPVAIQPAPTARPLLAVLTSSEGYAVLAVSFTPDKDGLAALPKSVEPGGKVPELWVLPAGGKPHSLGVLASADPSWRKVDPTARPYLRSGAALAVSLEPAGGSLTGAPTGPVILTGILSEPS